MAHPPFLFLCAMLFAAGPALCQTNGDAVRGAAKTAACASCHGAAERPPLAGMPALAGQQPAFLVLQMFFMREGLRAVPAMTGMLKDFSDCDLEDTAAFYASQKPLPDTGKRDEALYTLGASLSRGMGCGNCHLADYRGQRHIPRLTGQREDYLAVALQAYRDDKRTGADTSMNAAMYGRTDSDIRALEHYLAQQP